MSDVILLHSSEDGAWRAELPDLLPSWQSDPGDIHSVVAAAREAAGNPAGADLKLKVTEKTRLARDDVLALIEANDGPGGLDLSRCSMWLIDLSDETFPPLRDPISRPSWVSLLGGVNLARAQLQMAGLTEAQLQGADLTEAQLGGADPTEAQLRVADLIKAQLRGADLSEATSLAGAHWYGALLDHNRMRRDQLGKAIGDEVLAKGEIIDERRVTHTAMSPSRAELYRRASESYLLLKNNFSSIGRYEDAAWAYFE